MTKLFIDPICCVKKSSNNPHRELGFIEIKEDKSIKQKL